MTEFFTAKPPQPASNTLNSDTSTVEEINTNVSGESDISDGENVLRNPVTNPATERKETSDAQVENVTSHSHSSNEGPINDIGLWPGHLSQQFIRHWAKEGSKNLQNCDENLLKLKSSRQKVTDSYSRKCTPSMFERRNRNGEVVKRSWLCFSPSDGRVYCYFCKLLAVEQTHTTKFAQDGFCDWRHASERLVEHERSKDHLNAAVAVARLAKEAGRVDLELEQQAEQAERYWCSMLKRLVSVIKFVCERGLAFRGENEILGSASNGNYLGILELLAEYDDFLKQHIQKFANPGSGHTNYLSSTICEELIEIMGKQVLEKIVSYIQASRYYSITLDSTTDESHVDQLTLVFRYIENGEPVERFVNFMANQGHKAQDMFNALKEFLDEHNIDIKHCRGQSYDNASAMSGKYNGLQAKVIAENNLAAWIPCAGHSLNLVAKAAAECCSAAVDFFDFLEKLYVFFTASTNRYEILTASLKSADSRVIVPKRVTTTRWSCRADASKALVKGYSRIKEALAKIADDPEENAKARCEANGLCERMYLLETGIYSVFWNEILDRVNNTSKMLQDSKIDLNTAVALLKSLKSFVEAKRECFQDYERKGMEKAGTNEYAQARQRRRNVRLDPLDYGQAPAAELSPSEKFRTERFLPIIDQFLCSLEQRLSAYQLVCSLFAFLDNLETLTPTEIQDSATKLANHYKDDLDEQCLGIELVQFAEFLKSYGQEDDVKTRKVHFLYKMILDKHVIDVFPNVEIALRMYLVLMVTNCGGERSFSKLKYIKNRLRTTMTQRRLTYLTVMCMEHDILRKLNVDDLIIEFARRKARKVSGMNL